MITPIVINFIGNYLQLRFKKNSGNETEKKKHIFWGQKIMQFLEFSQISRKYSQKLFHVSQKCYVKNRVGCIGFVWYSLCRIEEIN